MQKIVAPRSAMALAALLGLALAAPAAAYQSAAAAPQMVPSAQAAPEMKSYPAILIITPSKAAPSDETASLDQTICKMGTPITGTRLGATRECHTQREWNEIRQEQLSEITRIQLAPVDTGSMRDCCEQSGKSAVTPP